MLGFQAAGAAPLVIGHAMTTRRRSRRRSASATRRAGQGSEGPGRVGRIIEAVSDDEILAAYRDLARVEGIFCEPASAASVAGVRKMAAGARSIPVRPSYVC